MLGQAATRPRESGLVGPTRAVPLGGGDATSSPANEVALQGGTVASIDAASPQGIIDALSGVLDDIRDSVIVPECTASLPRVLVVMDGSSSMIAGDAPGATNWDKARFALTGNPAAPNPGDPGYVEPSSAAPSPSMVARSRSKTSFTSG